MFPSLSVYFCESVKCPSVSFYLLEKHLLGMNPDSEEADTHAQQQSTPVHRLTAHHAVIAVLASVNQRVEDPAVHAKYARTIEAEQAEGDNQLQGRYALCFSKPSLRRVWESPKRPKTDIMSWFTRSFSFKSLYIS